MRWKTQRRDGQGGNCSRQSENAEADVSQGGSGDKTVVGISKKKKRINYTDGDGAAQKHKYRIKGISGKREVHL